MWWLAPGELELIIILIASIYSSATSTSALVFLISLGSECLPRVSYSIRIKYTSFSSRKCSSSEWIDSVNYSLSSEKPRYTSFSWRPIRIFNIKCGSLKATFLADGVINIIQPTRSRRGCVNSVPSMGKAANGI